MRKAVRPALMLLLAISFLLCSCRSAEDPMDSNSAAGQMAQLPSVSLNEPQNDLDIDGSGLSNAGSVSIPYTGNISSIRYITSASQLPDNEALAQYDDEYFQDHALILIYESVNSTSIRVGIQSIDFEGNTAKVTLSHQVPSEAITTAMATWLLWAEVDAGLDYQWVIENPALKSDHATE